MSLVVVVVLTVTLTTMSLAIPTQKMHLIMGPCPCGHDPLGPAPVCRAPKTSPQLSRRHHPASCKLHSCTVHTCLCCQRETARPDRRNATAGLHSFLHVDTGNLSSTTTGVSTSLSKQRHGMLCRCRQKPARRRDVHRHQQNQPCTATVVDDESRQSEEHNGVCNLTSKPSLHMPLPNKTTSDVLSFWSIPTKMPSILSMSTTEGNTA